MEPDLSVVLFRRIGWAPDDYEAWWRRLLDEQIAFVQPTSWQGEKVARLCFVNPRTTMDHVRAGARHDGLSRATLRESAASAQFGRAEPPRTASDRLEPRDPFGRGRVRGEQVRRTPCRGSPASGFTMNMCASAGLTRCRRRHLLRGRPPACGARWPAPPGSLER